jgi:hypothetical protein
MHLTNTLKLLLVVKTTSAIQTRAKLKKLKRRLLTFSFSSFFFSLSFLREFSCVLKLFECSYVLEMLVGCVNGTQPRVLGSIRDSSGIHRCEALGGSLSSGLSASPIN